MNINDKKIRELLEKTKNYRNSLEKSINEFGNFKDVFENFNVEELQEKFQKERDTFKIEDKRNVFAKCSIEKDGCIKKVKYKRINENGKKEENEILVKIPKEMKAGQRIIMYGQGNYVKELNKNSNLIIEIR